MSTYYFVIRNRGLVGHMKFSPQSLTAAFTINGNDFWRRKFTDQHSFYECEKKIAKLCNCPTLDDSYRWILQLACHHIVKPDWHRVEDPQHHDPASNIDNDLDEFIAKYSNY